MANKKREDGKNARTEASRKYREKAYDRIELSVKKGRKDDIQTYALVSSESVNGMINRLIDNEMDGAIQIKIDDDKREKLKQFCESKKMTVDEFINKLISKYL